MSKPVAPSLIHVPSLFSVVEPGVYRCASPTAAQVPFLATLNLRTIISLTPEHPIKPLLQLARSSNISFIHLGVTLWRPMTDWKPVRDEIVKATLEMMLDIRNHPLLILDPLGIHHIGCVVGALRVMQGWNFASSLVEYRAHSGPTKHRYSDEQYIELFDPDLINLPPKQYLPRWYKPEIDGPNEDDEEGDGDGDGDDAGQEQDQKMGGTASREVDGVIPGLGEATVPAVDCQRVDILMAL
ncbi:tyrosine phosphatase family-domain-containing protein [Naematelia encephala]|uniref:Tyrosine phosphatase family-domain-containing protein n=1 Tax=Naematelia encephala TaxID=71784 RepID=A0A1Y2ASV4_9TREE|nr:tyrosine phosphatase family-domain-containing protein [Naematelia encephala]